VDVIISSIFNNFQIFMATVPVQYQENRTSCRRMHMLLEMLEPLKECLTFIHPLSQATPMLSGAPVIRRPVLSIFFLGKMNIYGRK